MQERFRIAIALIDISFGVACLFPLLYAIRLSRQIEQASAAEPRKS